MKRYSNKSIIPKIILFLGTVSILGIILLFFRSRPAPISLRDKRQDLPEKLFSQVIESAVPQILELWERGDRFFPREGVKCTSEIEHEANVGKSYYQCNPHFWQCYWSGGVRDFPSIKVDAFDRTYHIVAKPSFNSLRELSDNSRFYQLFKRHGPGISVNYGYIVELEVKELPGLSQSMILSDSCRDTYLPQRIYGYGKVKDKKDEGFIWDNFDRHIFIDKYYVTNRQINEWYILNSKFEKIIKDRKKWPMPAFLNVKEQNEYCHFYGKRVMEAKLFDAATMSPSDFKNTLPDRIYRPETPWQRDLSKTFLGISRMNPDYQLTPLDCQLAQVQGCREKFFTTDSATWMGLHFALGFFPERLQNLIEPELNLKKSSRFFTSDSPWHELGIRGNWDGVQSDKLPVAFRCYEETAL